MIQRIQTVYLLIVAILMVVMMSFPVGNLIAADYTVTEFTNLALVAADGTADYAPWAMFVILVVAALLSFTTIFMFKKRMLQIRMSIFNSLLLVGYYIAFFAFYFALKNDENLFRIGWALCLPLVSIILNILAVRAIGRDEVMVKAADRLR